VELPEDDIRIETCWNDFKYFNAKKNYVCALVGVLIRLKNIIIFKRLFAWCKDGKLKKTCFLWEAE